MAPGEVAEWSNAPHSKCGIGASLSGVRIPPSPPRKSSKALSRLDNLEERNVRSPNQSPSSFLLRPDDHRIIRVVPRSDDPRRMIANSSRSDNTSTVTSPRSIVCAHLPSSRHRPRGPAMSASAKAMSRPGSESAHPRSRAMMPTCRSHQRIERSRIPGELRRENSWTFYQLHELPSRLRLRANTVRSTATSGLGTVRG